MPGRTHPARLRRSGRWPSRREAAPGLTSPRWLQAARLSYVPDLSGQPIYNSEYGLTFAPLKAGQNELFGPTAGVVLHAAQRWHVPVAVLWGVYGAESTWGRGGSNWFGLVNVPRTGSFSGDADAAARTLAELKQQTGSWATAISRYSGGHYTLAHVLSLAKTQPVPLVQSATSPADLTVLITTLPGGAGAALIARRLAAKVAAEAAGVGAAGEAAIGAGEAGVGGAEAGVGAGEAAVGAGEAAAGAGVAGLAALLTGGGLLRLGEILGGSALIALALWSVVTEHSPTVVVRRAIGHVR